MVRLIPLNETFKCMCLCPAHTGALRSYARARTWRLGPPLTRPGPYFRHISMDTTGHAMKSTRFESWRSNESDPMLPPPN